MNKRASYNCLKRCLPVLKFKLQNFIKILGFAFELCFVMSGWNYCNFCKIK